MCYQQLWVHTIVSNCARTTSCTSLLWPATIRNNTWQARLDGLFQKLLQRLTFTCHFHNMCIVALQPMQNSTSKCFEHVSSLGLSCPPAVHISAQSLPKHFPVRSVPKRFRINLHMRTKHTKATEHLVQCYRNQRNTENMNSRIAGEG